MDEVIVFKSFDQHLTVENSSTSVVLPGVIFSNRELLTNLEEALTNQHVLTLMTDTTFKLVIGQWVLMITGVIDTVVKSNGNITSHSFRPILFGLALSENIVGYNALFATLMEISEWCFPIPLPITNIINVQDRNDAMCHAFQECFYDKKFLVKPCIVHILRNVRQNAHLLIDREYVEVISCKIYVIFYFLFNLLLYLLML